VTRGDTGLWLIYINCIWRGSGEHTPHTCAKWGRALAETKRKPRARPSPISTSCIFLRYTITKKFSKLRKNEASRHFKPSRENTRVTHETFFFSPHVPFTETSDALTILSHFSVACFFILTAMARATVRSCAAAL
jgi:hypothetical protein